MPYNVGSNDVGCLPDSGGYSAETFEEARFVLISDILHDADYYHNREEGDELANLAEDVNLWSNPDTLVYKGRAYWIAAETDIVT